MSSSACSPSSYYSGTDYSAIGRSGGGGSVLKSALHSLIDDHQIRSYDYAKDALRDLDEHNATHISLIYSCHAHLKADFGNGRWNREHSWPKSYGLDTSGPDYSDLHMLYAADSNVNSARSSRTTAAAAAAARRGTRRRARTLPRMRSGGSPRPTSAVTSRAPCSTWQSDTMGRTRTQMPSS